LRNFSIYCTFLYTELYKKVKGLSLSLPKRPGGIGWNNRQDRDGGGLNGFTIFRIVFFAAFFGLHCVLMIGLAVEWIRDRKTNRPERRGVLPTVSVIIPLHNESMRMAELLKSLASQDYPAAEIIFVDDRSSDGGTQKLECFVRNMMNRRKCRIITVTENPGPNYKQYALGKGIEAAGGDFLLFTDADCEVSSQWISVMASHLENERVGAVIGPVFKKNEGNGFFWFYQCIDHAVRYLYLAGISGMGAAGGGFGNNLILRRKSLEAIGGYGSVPFSPTEDAALVARIRTHSPYQVHATLDTGARVFTRPEQNWDALINQTLRWNNGGLFSPDMMTRLGFNYLMISILLGFMAIPLLPFFPGLWPLPLGVILSMVMNTAAIGFLFRPVLPRGGFLTALYYIFQLVFTPLWMAFLTALGFFRVATIWKGSKIIRRI
jgi:cellulose synthase/poly-beta-1,6-N-acetylglucosamine synthase-like glycosyltransferase